MILVTNPQQFEKLRLKEMAELFSNLVTIHKQYLRKTFDTALLDSTAQASIDMAKSMKFHELAAEMERDLETERSFITN